jgi:hypothetical protein
MGEPPEHIWGKVEKVECVGDIAAFYILDGKKKTDVFSIYGLTKGKIYHPLGMVLQTFEDGTRELCYIIEDDEGKIGLRSVRNFKVVS